MKKQSIHQHPITKVNNNKHISTLDHIAVEEPVEMRLEYWEEEAPKAKSISITMRTPGEDFDLTLGFLFTENILTNINQITAIKHCGLSPNGDSSQNVVKVSLAPDHAIDLQSLERHFYTSSSCGVCGKTSIEAVSVANCQLTLKDELQLKPSVLHQMPLALREAQSVFDQTGGLHAAALFDLNGEFIRLREDVGRHNALDKLIGSFFRENQVPLSNKVLLLSGRISFELVQKALMAGIPIIAAVGAPSSLAISLAEESGITLIGFLRNNRFNIYCGAQRISHEN